MSELLPCPFCGGEAQVARTAAGYWAAYCEKPMCGRVGNFKTETEAIEVWNTRSAGTCHLFRRAAYGTVDGVELALYECSECGEPIEPKDGWNYCPNCGACVTPKNSETTPKVVSE